MVYNPNQPIQLMVEIYVPPLGWVDITARGRKASCRITQGRSGGSIQAEPSQLSLRIGNPDGYVSEDNPMSPWYPYIGRGCPIRVSRLGLTVSPAQRFYGQIATLVGEYPGGNVDATTTITATGTLGILGRGADPLRSAMYRTMAGTAEGDVDPLAYWPCTDGTEATKIAAATAGTQPAQITGAPEFAAASDCLGSEPLPRFPVGSTASGPVPVYVDTGQWLWQFAMKIDVKPVAITNVAEVRTVGTGSGMVKFGVQVRPVGATTELALVVYDAAGAVLLSCISTVGAPGNTSEADFYGKWFLYGAGCYFDPFFGAGTHVTTFGYSGNGFAGLSGGSLDAGPAGRPAVWKFLGAADVAMGHSAFYVDADLDMVNDSLNNGAAIDGYLGELAADRMIRLCREESVAFELTGTAADTVAMGPQLIDTLLNNLRDCEFVDQGLMHDNGTAGAVAYVTRKALYNQTANLAVVQGSIEPGLRPTWDNRYVVNDVTSSQPDGGFAHIADETHVTKVRARFKGDRQANVAAFDQLPQDAGWAVHLGTAGGARYDSVGIDLRNPNGALLADAVAAHVIGDRLTVASTALPPQHPIDGIDGLTVGWTELLDVDTWLFRPNVVPYSPYNVFVIEAQARGRLDTAGSVLVDAASTSATSLKFATTTGPLWIDSTARPGDFPFDVGIAGQRNTVTAIAASTISFVSAGTASSGSSGSRTPGLPATMASGDLVLILASTRNSGTGIPDTPTNWYRFPAFEAASCVQLFGRIYDGVWTMPTVTYTGGAANEDTIAQSAALHGKFYDVANLMGAAHTSSLNPSAQDIATPSLSVRLVPSTFIALYLGWKQDDYTSVAPPGSWTEIQEASSTAGNDASQVWGYRIFTSRPAVGALNPAIVVTGGAVAISRGAVVAIRSDYQVATVTRGVNGVTKALSAGEPVSLWKPSVIAL